MAVRLFVMVKTDAMNCLISNILTGAMGPSAQKTLTGHYPDTKAQPDTLTLMSVPTKTPFHHVTNDIYDTRTINTCDVE